MISYTPFDADGQAAGASCGGDDALAALQALGVEAGSFERPTAVVSSTPMLSHARALLALQRRYGAVMTDHVRQRPWAGSKPFPPPHEHAPSWPEPDHEHRHEDREVRLVLQGRLRVLLRLPRGHAAAVFEAGAWLALPAGLAHVAQASARTGVELLRLFAQPHGWVAQATGATLPRPLLAWPMIHPPLALAA